MKNLFTICLCLASSTAFAVTVQVLEPCFKEVNYQYQLETIEGKSAADATLEAFDAGNIPYIGSLEGIQSILNTPIGKDSLEILGPAEYRAYGWCYQVDGVELDVQAYQYPLSEGDKVIQWHFGFAHFKDGEWLSMCEPVWEQKPDFICKNKH